MKHLKYFESNGTGWRQFNDVDKVISFCEELKVIKPSDYEIKRLDEWLGSRNWKRILKDVQLKRLEMAERMLEYKNLSEELYITKREDEWWIMTYDGYKGDFYFACDELDGLINCLKETGLVSEL